MTKNCVFSICAKNYLAQALTLRESTLKHNNVDFFIFLADAMGDMNIEGVYPLDEEWIPHWQAMAFKYNVIEFNTSIKPYCIKKLFSDGYDKVMYLDPDIYVTDCLDCIYDVLETKSVVLTPHYSDIITRFNGAVTEETFMCDGIFNLGFCALRNNMDGNEIADWWIGRLTEKCYNDRYNGLFVDQKWMDFIPGFFPETCHVSHHFGLNVAIWNLHERELLYDNKKYYIKRYKTGEEYPLIFFHFSGFDPFNTEVINRRHPQFNIHTYPSFSPIIEEYRALVYKNDYDVYSKMNYDFNQYENGYNISALHRRLYREYQYDHPEDLSNPFKVSSAFYQKLLEKGLLIKEVSKSANLSISKSDQASARKLETKILHPCLKLMFKLVGLKKYIMLIGLARSIAKYEYHYFFIKDKK